MGFQVAKMTEERDRDTMKQLCAPFGLAMLIASSPKSDTARRSESKEDGRHNPVAAVQRTNARHVAAVELPPQEPLSSQAGKSVRYLIRQQSV